MYEVKIPKMGMSTVEADLVKWHVSVGDIVQKGDALADVESEKTVVTIDAEIGGTVVEILVLAGQPTEVGTTICRIEERQ